MRLRYFLALLTLLPAMAWAQSAVPAGTPDPINPVILSKKDPAVTRDSIAARRNNPVTPIRIGAEILSKKEPVRTHPTVPSQGPPSIADPSLRDPAGTGVPNALTMQVVMAQKHTGISDAQWRKIVLEPINATWYPIRLTQVMLDTLDATKLDARYRYELVR